MQEDVIWEMGEWALIEKGRLITQAFDKLAPGSHSPNTDNGGSMGARGTLPQLGSGGHLLGPGTACSLPCAFSPRSHARAGGLCPAGRLGQTAAHRWLASLLQTIATTLGLGVNLLQRNSPVDGVAPALRPFPLFMVNQYMRKRPRAVSPGARVTYGVMRKRAVNHL